MRTKIDISIQDIYLAYCKEHGKVDKKEFKKILYDCNQLISDYILDGRKVKLPYKLSTIWVRKKQMQYNKLHFDYAEYNKTGIKSVHLNQHSDDFYAYVHWDKSKCKVKNKVAYRFDLSRANKRRLAEVMKKKNGHHIYEIK